MSTWLIITLAISLPLLFLLVIISPVYIGLCTALVWYYGSDMLDYIYDPSYMVSVYEGLYAYWGENGETLNFMDFELVVFGPMLAGILLSLLLFYVLIKYIHNIFVV